MQSMLGSGHSRWLFSVVMWRLSGGIRLNSATFALMLTHLFETKSELFIPFTPPPPYPPHSLALSLSRLLLDVTLRGLLENACDHSSRLLPWQPGPTHPTRHSHSVKHPLSEFEGPVHGATRAFAQTDMSRFLHLKGFPEV